MILQKTSDLIEIGNVFDHLNIVYKKHLNYHVMNTSLFSNDYMIVAESLRCKVIIEQVDVYKNVLIKLVDQLENIEGMNFLLFLIYIDIKPIKSVKSINILKKFNFMTSFV